MKHYPSEPHDLQINLTGGTHREFNGFMPWIYYGISIPTEVLTGAMEVEMVTFLIGREFRNSSKIANGSHLRYKK
jgi:hypothetical protein